MSLASEGRSSRRLQRAGARVVSKGRIGGGRLASEILRPSATGFLDRMLVDERAVRFESVCVAETAPVAGKRLDEADLYGTTGIRPLALLAPGSQKFVANPGGGEELSPGTRLVVAAAPAELRLLADRVGGFE